LYSSRPIGSIEERHLTEIVTRVNEFLVDALETVTSILSNLHREFTLVNEVHSTIRLIILRANTFFRQGVGNLNSLDHLSLHFGKVLRSSFVHHFSVAGGDVASLLHILKLVLRALLAYLPHNTEEGAVSEDALEQSLGDQSLFSVRNIFVEVIEVN